MTKLKPEIYAPGGSFASALAAFDAGADGVYLGMKEFSARKSATNFSLEQLRRIRGLAGERGKRIAVTLNTVIRDDEIDRLAECLGWLDALEVDAVIVQDLGACNVAARFFPSLTLHASTQMAVHNSAGITVAQELGLRRVVLARELPLNEIRRLRNEHPAMELEIFIHGALCYSFSGLCLASWALTGRSGNRGDCAQICRGSFDGGENSGNLFSCRDLSLGGEVLALATAGVDALKIEGRMKAPEYVFNTVRLYREILDRGEELPPAEMELLARKSALGFARTTTRGYINSPSGANLVNTGYSGHRGARLGTVSSVHGNEMTLALEADISLRDGVGLFFESGIAARRGSQTQSPAPLQFSVHHISCNGRGVGRAHAGETVTIGFPSEHGFPPVTPGAEVRHLSSRLLDIPEVKEAAYPMYRVGVDLVATLRTEGGNENGKGVLTFQAILPGERSADFCATVTLDTARRRKPFAGILESILAESGVSQLRARRIVFVNRSGLPDDSIFIPPSELKQVKNDLYRTLDEALLRTIGDRANEVTASRLRGRGEGGETAAIRVAVGDQRERLSPVGSLIPFVRLDSAGIRPETLAVVDGFSFVPLPPVMLREEPWAGAVEELVLSNLSTRFAIGLSNLGHLGIAEKLTTATNAWFFIDFPLYVANGFTLELLAQRVGRLLFAYGWIEDAEPGFAEETDGHHDGRGHPVPVIRLQSGFRPPLFLSSGCFAKHSLLGGRCPDEVARRRSPDAPHTGACPRLFEHNLTQGSRRFRVVVQDCVTYLF